MIRNFVISDYEERNKKKGVVAQQKRNIEMKQNETGKKQSTNDKY